MHHLHFLVICLFLALLFEFVNGFHDTANAIATVIYTKALKPGYAVALSGLFNLLGVFFSGTAVAFGILKLLPARVLEQKPIEAPLSIVLAALIAAILWNGFTWYRGIPSSSSHTLIGSIIGVGLAYSTLPGETFGAGINFVKLKEIGLSLLISPFVGFFLSFLLFKLFKRISPKSKMFFPLKENQSPTPAVRAALIATCIGVSFAHGANDGQKGIGLIMLILTALLPGVYTDVPSWVIVSVAVSLGLGTTVGWKRIVITVGEKIGKEHLTPAQGAAAELTAAATIVASSALGLPVSTTHVLSSGIAGTMVAGGSGVQPATVKKIPLAWVLTLPISMILSGSIFYLLRFFFGLG